MNKWLVIFVVSIVSVVLTESSQRSDKQILVKALKEKFNQLKLNHMVVSDKLQKTSKNSQQHDKVPALVKTKDTPQLHQHENAASAIGLALLDIKKSKNEKKASLTSEKTKDTKKIDDSEDDFTGDHEDKYDKKTNTAVVSKKNKAQKFTGKETKHAEMEKGKKESGKSNNKKQQDDDNENDLDDDEDEDDDKDEDEESVRSDDSSKEEISESKKEEKSMKNSDKSLKNSVKSLKYSVQSLKDKDLQNVNVGQMKKLLATSVENLDKAEKAIHDLLQYDDNKKPKNQNKPNNPAMQGYPQQPYGGYQQAPLSPGYQTTCSGQCSSLCAPACRDPCCSFPPNGNNMGPPPIPMPGRGSYQQGLVNSYPPQTTLGEGQGGTNQFGQQVAGQQGAGQQCGSQCSSQSQCAPSCNPSCCASGGQAMPLMPQVPIVGPTQANAVCPQSCLSNCGMACPRHCCVPGRK